MARYATFFISIRPSCDICCGHLIIPTEVSNVILYYNKDQQKQHNCGHISITCKSTLFQINNAFSTVQGYYTKHRARPNRIRWVLEEIYLIIFTTWNNVYTWFNDLKFSTKKKCVGYRYAWSQILFDTFTKVAVNTVL